MNIIFIGGVFPPERRSEFIKMSKGPIQFAADTFQWSFIKGLDENFENVTIYTAPLLGNFPKTFKRIYSRSSNFSHNSKNSDYCVGSLRIPILGLLSKTINLYNSLLKNNRSINNTYLLVYSIHTPYLLAAVRYKWKFPDLKICLIVPDLPEYMSSNTGKLYSFLKKIDKTIIKRLIKHMDSFVFITDQMASVIDICNKPWVRIEGIYNPENFIGQVTTNENDNIILYTGTLDSRYGILDLLDAFKLISHPNYKLWICGDGNMKNKVVEYSLNDKRVKYFGQIPHSEILDLQKRVSILVNPRTSKGEYTKFSFPIKTMEYIASGKPCIMHQLPGIPDEYIEYLFVPKDETVESLSEKIIEVCNMDPHLLLEKCKKGSLFILDKKNPQIQISKLKSLLNG